MKKINVNVNANLNSDHTYSLAKEDLKYKKKQDKKAAKQAKKVRNQQYDLMIDNHLHLNRSYFENQAKSMLNDKSNHYNVYDIDRLTNKLVQKRKKQLKKKYKNYYK